MRKLHQRESRDGVEPSIRLNSDPEAVESVMRRHQSVDRERAVIVLDDVRLSGLDIRQLTGDRLEQVGLCDDTLEGTILVENGCKTDRILLEMSQHPEDGSGLGNDAWCADHRERVEFLAIKRLVEELLFHDHA